MIIRLDIEEARVSGPASARIARRLRLALEPFAPRVARATIRIRRREAREGRTSAVHVDVAVPLGPAGVARVAAEGRGITACAETAIARAEVAVARRLTLERQQLLQFLVLASGGLRGAPAEPRRPVRRRTPKTKRPASGRAGIGGGRANHLSA